MQKDYFIFKRYEDATKSDVDLVIEKEKVLVLWTTERQFAIPEYFKSNRVCLWHYPDFKNMDEFKRWFLSIGYDGAAIWYAPAALKNQGDKEATEMKKDFAKVRIWLDYFIDINERTGDPTSVSGRAFVALKKLVDFVDSIDTISDGMVKNIDKALETTLDVDRDIELIGILDNED